MNYSKYSYNKLKNLLTQNFFNKKNKFGKNKKLLLSSPLRVWQSDGRLGG